MSNAYITNQWRIFVVLIKVCVVCGPTAFDGLSIHSELIDINMQRAKRICATFPKSKCYKPGNCFRLALTTFKAAPLGSVSAGSTRCVVCGGGIQCLF